MRMFRNTCGAILGLGLILGLAGALSGCDAARGTTEYKPIQSNILKKLGDAHPGQSEAVRAKLPARVKKKR